MTDQPRKPAYRQPCNGCGICCMAEPCAIAVELISGVSLFKPCPALEWEAGRFWCGLVRHPSRHINLPVRLAGEERPLAVDQIVDGVLGPLIAEDLGGVGGECDAGPWDPQGKDRLEGLTAAEWLTHGERR